MATFELYSVKDVFRTVDLVGVEHLSISFGAILEGRLIFKIPPAASFALAREAEEG